MCFIPPCFIVPALISSLYAEENILYSIIHVSLFVQYMYPCLCVQYMYISLFMQCMYPVLQNMYLCLYSILYASLFIHTVYASLFTVYSICISV
jgi:hypothetical protein